MEIENKKGEYVVPLHEFTKHALLGEFSYYNPQSSLVACNVFDVSAADPREHFLASLLVSYLSSNLGNRDNDGFVSGDAISVEMLRHGLIEEQVFSSLRRLAAKRLIETPYSHYRELQVPDSESPINFYYRSTSIGLYHVRFWTGSFSFLDATSTDTPVFDEIVRTDIATLAASFEIADRQKKATCFRDYLESKWHLANFDAAYYDFPTVVAGQARGFELVERVVSKISESRVSGRGRRDFKPR